MGRIHSRSREPSESPAASGFVAGSADPAHKLLCSLAGKAGKISEKMSPMSQ